MAQVLTGLHNFDALLHLHTVLLKYTEIAARRNGIARFPRVRLVVMLLKQRTTC
jgi:hypothetical protein